MDPQLAGRSVLVTGAAGGIGAEIVRQLAACEAVPWIHYRGSREAALALCTEIGAGEERAVRADLRLEQEVAAAFGAVDGPLHGLVVNAGIWEAAASPVRDMTLDQWRNTLASNLDSAFLCCRAFLRGLDPAGPAPAIVLVGSTAGVFGEEGHADYSASKSAMRGLVLTLKNEIVRLHPQGRVNLVDPGWIVTPMAERALEDHALVDRITATMALRKVGRPHDVAAAVLFLLSSRLAGHVTGQFLTVAGGMEGRLLHAPDSGA